MNPFTETVKNPEALVKRFSEICSKPYRKQEVDPYTKTRIILMNGTEFEAERFSHRFARHTDDNDLRREIALTRFLEAQQQLRIALLKPADETILEHTISYEQLAVDLTAELAQREGDCAVKQALDFALLEDFDHLYRYADLLESESGVKAEHLVGKLTEITPGRPTVAHARAPKDNIRFAVPKDAEKATKLHTMIITAAEQQTMNYYKNVTPLYQSDIGRRLYAEIALVEEEHVSQYESLTDASGTWLERLLWHEYCECYLYWSCFETETDARIKALWEEEFACELSHLHRAAKLLERYEKKEWRQVIGEDGSFPAPLSLHSNIEYVRAVLKQTVQYTAERERYVKLSELDRRADFFRHQRQFLGTGSKMPSHVVIEEHIVRDETDYRYETERNPIPALRVRTEDNLTVGREADAAPIGRFSCPERAENSEKNRQKS